jgi:hypothetical protein
MSGISAYTNQAATLKRPSAYTSAGGATTASSSIRVRFEPYTRQMTDVGGEVFTSQARIFTASEVRVGDTITYATREWPVRNVKMQPGLDGTADHYEVIL